MVRFPIQYAARVEHVPKKSNFNFIKHSSICRVDQLHKNYNEHPHGGFEGEGVACGEGERGREKGLTEKIYLQIRFQSYH